MKYTGVSRALPPGVQEFAGRGLRGPGGHHTDSDKLSLAVQAPLHTETEHVIQAI